MKTDPYRWIPIALGLLVLGVLALAYQNHRLSQRVGDLEERIEQRAGTAGERGHDRRGGAHGRDRGDDGAVFLADGERSRGGGRAGGRGGWGDGPDAGDEGEPVSLDEMMEDPAFQERLGDLFDEYSSQERAERNDRRREYVADRVVENVAEFAAEHDLDADTEARLSQIMVDYMNQRMDLRDAMMEGEGDHDEINAERDRLQAETEAALVEMLGQELVDELDDVWPGPRRR